MDHPFRTFCAIELSDEVRHRIQLHIDQLRSTLPDAKPSWTRVENIHLTIKFFGDVEQKRLSLIDRAAAKTASEFQPFELSLAGTGAFPKVSQPRVLWIGVNDRSGKLSELQASFEMNCAREGFVKEDRAFRPHLTIARIRSPFGARALAEANQQLSFESITQQVNELIVFRSELSGKGSKYTPLHRQKLSDRK